MEDEAAILEFVSLIKHAIGSTGRPFGLCDPDMKEYGIDLALYVPLLENHGLKITKIRHRDCDSELVDHVTYMFEKA